MKKKKESLQKVTIKNCHICQFKNRCFPSCMGLYRQGEESFCPKRKVTPSDPFLFMDKGALDTLSLIALN